MTQISNLEKQILADGWIELHGSKNNTKVFTMVGNEHFRLVYNARKDRVDGAYIALPNKHLSIKTKYQYEQEIIEGKEKVKEKK